MKSNSESPSVPNSYNYTYYPDRSDLVRSYSVASIPVTKSFVVRLQKNTGPSNAPTVNSLRWTRNSYSHWCGSSTLSKMSGERLLIADGRLGISELFHLPVSADFSAQKKAYRSLLSKIRDTKANLAVDIAESKSTSRMVQSAVDRVLHFAVTARRASRNPLKTLSDYWLEYQYGWKPALQTIYEVANFTRDVRNGINLAQSASSSEVFTGTQNVNGHKALVSTSLNRSVRYGCRYSPANQPTKTIQQLTTLNPALIAWELVPYSFVIDWFVDIGGYLEDCETVFSLGNSVSNAFVTYYTTVKTEGTIADEIITANQLSSSLPAREQIAARAYRSTTYYDRDPTVFSYPSRPTVSFDTLGASRCTSAAALLYQIFTRK